MKEIALDNVTTVIARLFKQACYYLSEDVLLALKNAREMEVSPLARVALDRIIQNVSIADKEQIPLCQDTGFPIVWLQLGQEVHLTGGHLEIAVNEGVRRGYDEGYLRKSVVEKPFSSRVNTGDNTPADIWVDIVPGDKLKVTVMPKGSGSENMSCLAMLTPSQGSQSIIDFVVNCVDRAGANPCPPILVGVGIGGTAEKTVMLAKKALLRMVGNPNPDEEVANLERDILERVNRLGIGTMGYGGKITALAVHVETFPCHIASLPLAVNLQCWCHRWAEAII
jgi:fumarate hydratase subunit alpha